MAVVGETGDVGFGSGAAQVHNNLIDAVHHAISFHPSPHAKADYGNILARLLQRQAKAHAAAGQTHGGAGYGQTHGGSAPRSFLPVVPDGTQTTGGFGGPQDSGDAVPGMQPGQVISSLAGPNGPTYYGQQPIFDPSGINQGAVINALANAQPASGFGGIFDPPSTSPAGLNSLLQAILKAGRGGTGAIFGPVAT